MRTIATLMVIGLGAFAAGCNNEPPISSRGCALTAEGASVSPTFLHVRDQTGAPVCDARVTARDATAEEVLRTNGDCSSYEMPGRVGLFQVKVEKPGYRTAKLDVTVDGTSNGCAGPDTADARLAPASPACDGASVESLRLDLRDERGTPVCDADVTVREGAFERDLTPTALADGTCAWSGLPDRPGTYKVSIGKEGYERAFLPAVVVASDPAGCHVVPAEVAARLVRAKP